MLVPNEITASMNARVTWWMQKYQPDLLQMVNEDYRNLLKECGGLDAYEAAKILENKGWHVNGWLVLALADLTV